MRYCHKCGQQLSENATYCPKCGTLVSKNNVETRNHSSDKSHEQSLILPIAAAFLVIIAVGLTFFIGHKKTHVSDADPNNMNENEQVTVGTTSEEDNSESTEGKTEQITEQTKEEPFSFPDITSMNPVAGAVIFNCVEKDISYWTPNMIDSAVFWDVMCFYVSAESGISNMNPPRAGEYGEFYVLPAKMLINAGYACFPDFTGTLPPTNEASARARVENQDNLQIAIGDTINLERKSYVNNEDKSVDAIYSYHEWGDNDGSDYRVHMSINPDYDKANDYFTYYYTIEYVEQIQKQEAQVEEVETVKEEAHLPFYGIWCGASKDRESAESIASSMRDEGLPAEIFITTDWSNLNTEKWYVISAGVYETKQEAENMLSRAKDYNSGAYIKYSGEWIGE